MNNLFTVILVVMVGLVLAVIVRTIMQFKKDIDGKIKESGARKQGESIKSCVDNIISRDADPAQFDDLVALQTSWLPAKRGGSNFQTHTLLQVNASRIEFRASVFAKIFSVIFMLMGIGIAIGFSVTAMQHGAGSLPIFPLIFGGLFFAIGGGMFYWFSTPIVFDKTIGFFWKGRQVPQQNGEKKKIKNCTRLEEIHALQLVSEYCSDDKRAYHSYELNLVLKGGERINVIDHGVLEKIRANAASLSQFLEKPVWDVVAK